MILAFQQWIICAYEQIHRDMDVFCLRTQILLNLLFDLQTLDYLHVSIKIWRICQRTKSNNNGVQNKGNYTSRFTFRSFCACTQKTSKPLLRICVYAQIIQRWKTLLYKTTIRNFCACTKKTSTSLLRICVYAQIIQCGKTLLFKTTIRNFCACTQKTSTSLFRICEYMRK